MHNTDVFSNKLRYQINMKSAQPFPRTFQYSPLNIEQQQQLLNNVS